MVFGMEKYGVILEGVNRTLSMQILFGRNEAPRGQIKGDNSTPILKICSQIKCVFICLYKKYRIRNLV